MFDLPGILDVILSVPSLYKCLLKSTRQGGASAGIKALT